MDYGTNFRAPRVDIHSFSMIPRADIPRSKFKIQHQHKTTFDASVLIPFYVQEILPGDTWSLNMTAFVRMATPIAPILDNLTLETWYFFVPNRIVWTHWVNFMGEQPASPADSISYTIPQIVSPANGFAFATPYDYMGIPGVGQITAGGTLSVNALPLRAYNMIWNQWFRDENLDTAVGYGATNTVFDLGDGPDPSTNYAMLGARKRHDYFTSGLPWTQKGGVAITLPLGTSAPVKTSASRTVTGAQAQLTLSDVSGGGIATSPVLAVAAGNPGGVFAATTAPGANANNVYPANLFADLSAATAATINQIRLAFQTQRLLERDARGGTRYQELLMSHFGVHPLDARLQRPEYLGGTKTPLNISPVPQTGGTGASGTTSPMGTLAGVGTGVHRSGFRQSFTEHGHVIGLLCVRADMSYQQGLRRMWTRSTRYDFYWPVFSMLGEQSIRNDEIYTVGTIGGAQDAGTFAFQERWAEYRYTPSMTTAGMRSTAATTADYWHLAQKFTALPALNTTFISDSTLNTLDRVLAAGSTARTTVQQFYGDFLFDQTAARPLPMYSVPGMVDHF